MNRITKDILRAKVDYLNQLTDGKLTLDYAYGGVRLVKLTNEHGGVADMSERVSKPEMARILDSITNIIVRMK